MSIKIWKTNRLTSDEVSRLRAEYADRVKRTKDGERGLLATGMMYSEEGPCFWGLTAEFLEEELRAKLVRPDQRWPSRGDFAYAVCDQFSEPMERLCGAADDRVTLLGVHDSGSPDVWQSVIGADVHDCGPDGWQRVIGYLGVIAERLEAIEKEEERERYRIR